MPLRSILAALATVLVSVSALHAEPPAAAPSAVHEARMPWFREAKFGLFIHWGLYSVPARGEWVMNKEKIPVAKYAAFAESFNPTKFDADEWVKLAKDAGVKYIIITSKHHDGFAMFNSKVSKFNIVEMTPFQRDPLKELADACRKQDIRLGFYYSHSQDWHHPGGSIARAWWDPAQKGDFDEYLKKIAVPQIKELLTNYGPVATLWCDTPFNMTPERCELIVKAVRETQPNTLINSRLRFHGREIATLKPAALDELREVDVDYLSYADRQIPSLEKITVPQWRDWETCMTLNNSWGFTAKDTNWKTADTVVRNLVEVVSKGGNYLLNVGPTSEGVIPEQSADILRDVGVWLHDNGEAIYGAGPAPEPIRAGGATVKKAPPVRRGRGEEPPRPYYLTTKPGKIFVHVFERPVGGRLQVPGLPHVNSVYVLSDKNHSPLTIIQQAKTFVVHLPEKPEPIATVICLEVAGQ